MTNTSSDTVSVINSLTVDATITVGDYPVAVAIDDAGVDDAGVKQGLVYVTNHNSNTVSVIGSASPSLGASSGNTGDAVTINVNVPQVPYDVDDSTVESVSFGGTILTPTAQTGDAWQVTAPAGTPGASAAVTVTFRGGLTASAGTFTYKVPQAPPPASTQTSTSNSPGAPGSVLAVAGDRSAEVTWTAPSVTGSSPLTEYEAEASPSGSSCQATPPTTSCTVTGLTNGSAYTFRVRAKNSVGWGAWSENSNTVTPKEVASIVITGSRDRDKPKRIRVSGTTTGLTGTVTPWLQLRSGKFKAQLPVLLKSSGKFRWSVKTSAGAQVYMTQGSAKSNTIIIRPR